MTDDTFTEREYQFTTIEYNHPDSRYRSRKHVSVEFYSMDIPITAGAGVKVA